MRQEFHQGLKQHRLRRQLGLVAERKPEPKPEPEPKIVLKHPRPRHWVFTTVIRPPTPPATEESDTSSIDTESTELVAQLLASVRAPRVALDAELTQPHVVFAIDFDAELRSLHK